MEILFICGSMRAQESCRMTLAEIGISGRTVMHDGSLPDIMENEEIVVLDDAFGLYDQVVELKDSRKWIFRIRDRLSALSKERGAIGEIMRYASAGVVLAHLDEEIAESMSAIFDAEVIHLPDVFGTEGMPDTEEMGDDFLNVCCFGGQDSRLAQAFAVLELHRETGRQVMFHCSSTDDVVDDNLQSLFMGRGVYLARHGVFQRPERRKLMALLDVGLQVSTSPARMIVSDYIDLGVPVVTSQTEEWLPSWNADADSPSDMCQKMLSAMKWEIVGKMTNRFFLGREMKKSSLAWGNLTG